MIIKNKSKTNKKTSIIEMATLRYENGNDVIIACAKIFINPGDHNPPHIHAILPNGKKFSINIKTFKSKSGGDKSFKKIKKSVVDWMMRNQDELLSCFELSHNMPGDSSIYTRQFLESLSIDDDLCDMVPIIDMEYIDDENILVYFNCGLEFKYNINQIPSVPLRNDLLVDKEFYYEGCDISSYCLFWGDDAVDAWNIWNDGEIV